MHIERFRAFAPSVSEPVEALECFNARVNKDGSTYRLDGVTSVYSVWVEQLDNIKADPYSAVTYDVKFHGHNVFEVIPSDQIATNTRITVIAGVVDAAAVALVRDKLGDDEKELMDFFGGTLEVDKAPNKEEFKKPKAKAGNKMEEFLAELGG
jgi:hypothetical protein